MTASLPESRHRSEATRRAGRCGVPLSRFRRDRRGATAIEYALIAGLIFLVITAGLQSFGIGMTSLFGKLSTATKATN